jgi:hypothetical protein
MVSLPGTNNPGDDANKCQQGLDADRQTLDGLTLSFLPPRYKPLNPLLPLMRHTSSFVRQCYYRQSPVAAAARGCVAKLNRPMLSLAILLACLCDLVLRHAIEGLRWGTMSRQANSHVWPWPVGDPMTFLMPAIGRRSSC